MIRTKQVDGQLTLRACSKSREIICQKDSEQALMLPTDKLKESCAYEGGRFNVIQGIPQPQAFMISEPVLVTPIANRPILPLIAQVVSINGGNGIITTRTENNSQHCWKILDLKIALALNGGDAVRISQKVDGRTKMIRFDSQG